MIDIRGGTVLFEPGALGGSFTGVYFTSDQTDFEVRTCVFVWFTARTHAQPCRMRRQQTPLAPTLPSIHAHARTHARTPNYLQDVMVAIRQTMTLVGIRIWGGHVLVAGGTVTFNGCIFYDLELLTPLSDRIYFGGDVLVRVLNETQLD